MKTSDKPFTSSLAINSRRH